MDEESKQRFEKLRDTYRNSLQALFKKRPRASLCEKIGIEELKLVNSGHVSLMSFKRKYPHSNIAALIAQYLPNASYVAKLYFRVIAKLHGITISICCNPKNLDTISVSVAGFSKKETIDFTHFIMIYLVNCIGLKYFNDGEAFKLRSILTKSVNNVLVLNFGNYYLNVEDYIDRGPDDLILYNPKSFPGAILNCREFMDCKRMILFSTAMANFLGQEKLSVFRDTLEERVKRMKVFLSPPVVEDGPKRQKKRENAFNEWKENKIRHSCFFFRLLMSCSTAR